MRSPTFLALAALGLTASALPAVAGTLLVPQKYPTIQKALNAAKPHDVVLVSAKPKGGVYNEAVTISTPYVVLQGVGGPIIDGTGLGVPGTDQFGDPVTNYPNGIDIQASHVAVRGLTVQNVADAQTFYSTSGINVGVFPLDGTVISFSDIEISGCTIQKNASGITIYGYAGPDATTGAYTLVKGYRLLGDTVTGNFNAGALIAGGSDILVSGSRFLSNTSFGLSIGSNAFGVPAANAQIVACQFTGNLYDGLDAFGSGLSVIANRAASNGGNGLNVDGSGFSVTANEAALNGGPGIAASGPRYNPAVSVPGTPNPAASVVQFNSTHDNKEGLHIAGTLSVSGNSVTHNAGFGLTLVSADYSQITYNTISATTLAGFGQGDGAGLLAIGSFGTSPGPVTISANAITGNAGDGIFFATLQNSTISRNNVSRNSGIGIHLSDTATQYASLGFGGGPNTVTQNVALHNTIFDARDDASAPDNLTYNGSTYYGDNSQFGPTVNVWTKNLFGTTDPVGLSK